jgi:3'-phosphoadenosine 5'-phosphosulfate sulfotransferase (PAPS reductase)/FAD synthetase
VSALRIVSVSGGKDSTATLLLALETNWSDDVRAVFADTGNEHEITLEYIDYLERMTGVTITRVMADFTDVLARKRVKLLQIADGVPESEIYGSRVFSAQWTPERAAIAAEKLRPTGNAFLDLCLLKGGFPSKMRQFCTEHLKQVPIERYTMALIDEGHTIEQWHGVRAEESKHRAGYPDHEWGPLISIRRPILRWGVDRVFEQHRRYGVNPNPLYSMGSKRVGCMPCINGRSELSNIARRYPQHVEKVREYERLVSECSPSATCSTRMSCRHAAVCTGCANKQTMIHTLIDSLIDRLIAFAERRPYIHLEGYMDRWWLIPYNRFGIAARIHHIKRSDADRHFHDHPWWSISIILRGGYWEWQPGGQRDGVYLPDVRRWRGPGSLVLRRATQWHRLELHPVGERVMPCWSLFICGRARQEWGFLVGGRKVPARDYLGDQYIDTQYEGGAR